MNQSVQQKTAYRWGMASLFFTALVPDFAAPVFAAVCVWAFAMLYRQQKAQLHLLQVALALFLVWRILGIFYSEKWINSLSITALWVLFFFGAVLIPMVITNRAQLDKALLYITGSGATAGGIGIVQMLLYQNEDLPLTLRTFFNPFWQWINEAAAHLLSLDFVPAWVLNEIPRTVPIDINNRASSTFTNPVFFACFLVLVFPVAFYGMLYFQKRWQKLFGGVSCLLILGGIAFSYSRGPYLALVVSLGVLLFMGWKVVLIFVGASPFAVVAMAKTGVFSRLLTLLSSNDISVNTRSDIWKACGELLQDHWLFGLGTGVENLRDVLIASYSIHQPHAHNLWLELLIENGVFGLLLFVGILVVFFVDMLKLCRISKQGRALGVALLAGVFGFLTCGMTDYIFYGPKFVHFFLLFLGVSLAAKSVYQNEELAQHLRPKASWNAGLG